MIRHH